MILGALAAGCEAGDPGDDAQPSAASVAPAAVTEALRGTVVVYTATFDEGIGDQQYFVREGENETRLYFETDPRLVPGTPIEVRGRRLNEGLRVESYHPIDEGAVGLASQPLIMGMTYKPRTFGFVLVDIGGGMNLTKEKAQKALFGTAPGDKSVKQYYNEVSYGTQDITGEVLGPFKYAMTGCDTTGMARTLKPMLGAIYDHYLWYFGSRTTACQFSGLAEGGLPDKPTNDTWYNGSYGCVVLVQEPGHNFGMMHSSSMTCGSTPFADNPAGTCTHNEYGDRYDPMGGACNHMNAFQKVFEGWLQKCNGVRVKSSGTYTLQPLELACDGPQVLQIPMPKVRPFNRSGGGGTATQEKIGFYYLELRTARGFDDTIRSAPTVLVHVAEDMRDRQDRGRHVWILDMDPSSRTIEGLTMGKSFTDPAGGVSFTVSAISPDSATIEVTVPNGTGAPTCIDESPFDPALPRLCGGIVGMPGTAPTTPATVPPRVELLFLVDADTGKDIRMIEDMAVLDLNQLPPNLSVRADTDPMVVGSVVFRIDAGMPRPDSTSPYAISNDNGRGGFAPWGLTLGAHTINAVAFDAANGGGRPGEPLEIDFTLTRGGVVPPDGMLDGTGLKTVPVAGQPALAAAAGTGVAVNPTLASSAGTAPLTTAGAAALPPLQNQPPSGCSCHVPGTGAGKQGASGAWALALLALGWSARRRRRQ